MIYKYTSWTHWDVFADRTRLFWQNCTGKLNIFRVQPLVRHHPDSVCLSKRVTEHKRDTQRETAEQSSAQWKIKCPAAWRRLEKRVLEVMKWKCQFIWVEGFHHKRKQILCINYGNYHDDNDDDDELSFLQLDSEEDHTHVKDTLT